MDHSPGGSAWTLSPGQGTRKEVYLAKKHWEQQPALSSTEYYEKMKATWARILPRYFRGKQRAALSMTGGVDSRTMLACAPCPSGTLPS